MNEYTLEQQEEQDNEQYSDIAYKEHLHELFLKCKKRNEWNKADTSGIAGEDNYINNNLSYGDNNHGYHFNQF